MICEENVPTDEEDYDLLGIDWRRKKWLYKSYHNFFEIIKMTFIDEKFQFYSSPI